MSATKKARVELPYVLLGPDEDWDDGVKPTPKFDPEDWKRYQKSLQESGGFDIEPFPELDKMCVHVGPLVWSDDVIYKEGVVRRQSEAFWINDIKTAIEQRNQRLKEEGKEESILKFERLIKLNGSFSPMPRLYYTFEARNVNDGTKKAYQALLVPRSGRKPGCNFEIFRERIPYP